MRPAINGSQRQVIRYFYALVTVKWNMRLRCVLFTVASSFAFFSACGPRPSTEGERRAADTPAGKVGQVAHRASVEMNKAGRAVGRELKQAAQDAHAGWKEDARKQRGKQ